MQATAPERIYLQGGPQLPPETEFGALSEVTWCRDDVDGVGIPYVRADLAGAAPAAVAGWGCEDRSAWYALAMGAAASLEDAANCLRDKDAQKAAMGSATHVRESCNKLWWSVPALEAPAAPDAPPLTPDEARRAARFAELWNGPSDATSGSQYALAGALAFAAKLAAAPQAPAAPAEGEVLVEVIGLTGSGKSAICGEIEILCRALGLDVSWPDGDPEKNMTHAEWTAAIEAYKPRVRIVERNVPRQSNGGPAK
ncbi:hypothetical protein N5C96_29150 [Delftia tsuruhatensis]|uniref:hypothetical protein n=1 Tax=Delftia tsuruhatensis TaxID=180282 RepID=UPI00244C22B3|nr:hypothetical protein [Delftia tsuruhatensis]MDH0777487.1 hypothetical protein [Delftia tsuruhatensis]MDH1461820.1 hypothetical protein [Delftia tsuruhatensis]